MEKLFRGPLEVFGVFENILEEDLGQGVTEGPTRQGARPHPRGPLAAPPTYFLLIYIPIYPENIQEHHKTLFPPPQPYVPVRSHLGAFSGAPPEGESIKIGRAHV